jgi:serine-type D-Ala-D-Ala carboxypeptidase (penicillin-binding protein 5/6)
LIKKVTIGGLAAVCILTAMPVAAAGNSLPTMHGKAAVLLDGVSGQILYQQNATEKYFPASTTKLLTALVAVEHGKMDQVIEVSANAVDQAPDSSSCYLEKGEKQRLETLMYGLLLVSGNDCAVAIAEGVSQNHLDQFITWMNETAKRLGANQSNFANPSGLHDPIHYTSALDLALIGRAALANPTIVKIAGTKEFFWPGKSERNGPYYNHNKMLFTYDGEIAGKNGYTEEAGLTLVSSAQRDGRMLIGVVMGEDNQEFQYGDMQDLLDYGFTQFEQKNAIPPDITPGVLPVTDGQQESVQVAAKATFPVSALKGAQPKVTVEPKLQKSLTAPVEPGQEVGVLEVKEGGRVLGTVPVVAEQAVAAKPKVVQNLKSWTFTGLKWLAGIILGLFLVRIVVKAIRRGRRRSRAGRIRKGSGRTGSIAYYRTKNN